MNLYTKTPAKKYLQTLLCFSAFASVSSLSATVDVTTTTDGGAGSLRNAILSINDGTGTGPIVFTVGGTFPLTVALPLIGPNVGTINPNGNAVIINGSSLHQAFTTQPNTTLTIGGTGTLAVTLSASVGGAGGGAASTGPGNGGGGALGAGGGIFVANGSYCDYHRCFFFRLSCQGGNGGAITTGLFTSGGGGGGGMANGIGGDVSSSGGVASGGGGGGGYGGPGGVCSANALGGGGGGGMLFLGGNATVSGTVGGGGGGSDANDWHQQQFSKRR